MRIGHGLTEDAHGGAPAASPRRPRCCPCHRHGSSAGFRTHGHRGLVRRPPSLLAVASQPSGEDQCILTVFVPVHRCGAVPDSHRVPSNPHPQVENRRRGAGYGGGESLSTASTADGIRTRNLCVLSAAPLPGWATAACASTAGTASAGSGSRTRDLQTLDLAPLPSWATPALGLQDCEERPAGFEPAYT